MPYAFVRSDGEMFWLKPCTDGAEEIPVSHSSVDVKPFLKKGSEYVSCQLVWYDGVWWVNGYLEEFREESYEEKSQTARFFDMMDRSLVEINKNFLKASGGERLVFCKDDVEAKSFLID